jgi:TPR repeat protein
LGTGVAKNGEAAALNFQAAAAQGLVEAFYLLGVCFERGIGVAADMITAVTMYKVAADAGLSCAQFRLRKILSLFQR